MKICLTTESYRPTISGVAIFTENLAKYLTKHNHLVIVICPSLNRKTYLEKENQFKIYRLGSIPNPFRQGHRFVVWPWLIVWRIIKKEQPDIIHAQDPAAISLSALWVGRRLKIPFVVTNHFILDYVLAYLSFLKPFHLIIRLILRHFINSFYNRATAITCPSKFVFSYLKNLGVKKPFFLIPNGVNLAPFFVHYDKKSIRKEFNLRTELPVVLYAGRLDLDKSLPDLIKAIAIINQETMVQLVLCGDGKIRFKLEKIIKKTGIAKQTVLLGFVDRIKTLPRIYQLADVFVTPSAIETQGLVVFEAMASGLPIVAVQGSALDEVVIDHKTGLKAPPHQPKAIAKAIISILQSPEKARQMGQNGRKLVKKINLDNSLAKFVQLYRQCLKEKKESK